MPDDTVTTSASDTAVLDTPAQGASVSYVSPDGKLTGDWKNMLPEELRGEKTLDTFSDVPGALKMLVHAQRKIGAEKIVRPNEKSTPEEWAAYYDAGGRPKTADEYKIEPPKGMEKFYVPEEMSALKAAAHANGMNQKQVDAVLGVYGQLIGNAQKASEAQMAKGVEELEKRWQCTPDSPAWKAKQDMLQSVLRDNMAPADLEEVKDTINKSPAIADVLVKLMTKYGLEDKPGNPDAEVQASGGILDQIRELRATPGFAEGTLSRDQMEILKAKLDALYAKAYPEKGSR